MNFRIFNHTTSKFVKFYNENDELVIESSYDDAEEAKLELMEVDSAAKLQIQAYKNGIHHSQFSDNI